MRQKWPCGTALRQQQVDREETVSKFADELIASLKQAAAHAKGRKVRGMRVTKVELPDVRPSAGRCACRSSVSRPPIAFRFPP